MGFKFWPMVLYIGGDGFELSLLKIVIRRGWPRALFKIDLLKYTRDGRMTLGLDLLWFNIKDS